MCNGLACRRATGAGAAAPTGASTATSRQFLLDQAGHKTSPVLPSNKNRSAQRVRPVLHANASNAITANAAAAPPPPGIIGREAQRLATHFDKPSALMPAAWAHAAVAPSPTRKAGRAMTVAAAAHAAHANAQTAAGANGLPGLGGAVVLPPPSPPPPPPLAACCPARRASMPCLQRWQAHAGSCKC